MPARRSREGIALRVVISLVLTVILLIGASGLYSALEVRRIARAFPPEGLFVTLPWGRLHYTERVPEGVARSTVILLHGASGNQADLMQPLGERLAKAGFRVVAFDRPGRGWSDRPDGAADASPARQAVLIREAAERLGIDHAIVLGHSWAGALAVNFALDQADFTDGLVLVSPVTHPWSTGIAWYYAPAASPWIGPLLTHTVALPVGEALIGAGIRQVFAPEQTPDGFAERTALPLLFRPDDFTANAQDVAALLAFVQTQAPREPQIRVPTAIVTGDTDHVAFYQLHSVASAKAIPGATLKVLPGVGHSPHWTHPEAVVQAVIDVWSRRADMAKSADTRRLKQH